MKKQNAFDCEMYVKKQSENIQERIQMFDNKLYLEFGGKLFDDYHASRVLPGFAPDTKVQMLLKMKDKAEIVIVINAGDIVKNKVRSDLGITYDLDVLRLIDEFREIGLYVGSVVITHYENQPAANAFKKKLEALTIKVALHYIIAGYPHDVAHIVSDEGFGINDYIETTRELVVITAPGPGSGKMAVCLSQMYHDNKRGIHSGYAKFETFPIWNLPLNHPVNLAYEAATADLNDVNMIDPFHFDTYNEVTINYNRDIEVFPVLKALFMKIAGNSPYHSPTDMGVNMAGYCIVDDKSAQSAGHHEIIRRYYRALCDLRKEVGTEEVVNKIELLMGKAQIQPGLRSTVGIALDLAKECNTTAVAIELNDGTVVHGDTDEVMGACSAALLNALKYLGEIPRETHLIASEVMKPIQQLKVTHMGNKNHRLHLDEILIALSIGATTNDIAKKAMEQLHKLQGAQVHSTVILSDVDVEVFKSLKMDLTTEPQYQGSDLFHK